MNSLTVYKIFTWFISLVWIINGLFCKVLNLVPRHQQIVGRILGTEYSESLTIIIGLLEIMMAVWILTRYISKLNVITQIIIILTMNIIEFFYVSDLLLFGKMNIIFSVLFVSIIYYSEFHLNSVKLKKN